MKKVDKLIREMEHSPQNTRFNDLSLVCEYFFGIPQIKGSHNIYKTPWFGDPRINIQNGGNGKAKAYQVKQVLKAITKLKAIK